MSHLNFSAFITVLHKVGEVRRWRSGSALSKTPNTPRRGETGMWHPSLHGAPQTTCTRQPRRSPDFICRLRRYYRSRQQQGATSAKTWRATRDRPATQERSMSSNRLRERSTLPPSLDLRDCDPPSNHAHSHYTPRFPHLPSYSLVQMAQHPQGSAGEGLSPIPVTDEISIERNSSRMSRSKGKRCTSRTLGTYSE
jgi:hypothetical protein